MRALRPCEELWTARAVPRLERATERKADGSVVKARILASSGLRSHSQVVLDTIGKALQAGPNTRFALVGSKLN